MTINQLTILFILFWATTTFAQNEIIIPRDIKETYSQDVRSKSGAPGQNYWQNHGDYVMDISYDPTIRRVSGEETIKYYNESPDTLHEIVIGLYQEVLSKNSERIRTLPMDKLKDETMILENVEIGGVNYTNSENAKKVNTNLIIKLDQPILPHSEVDLKFKWYYEMIEGIQIRTGDFGNGVSFIGYFYPRVVVYDDIEGWDKRSYNVLHEFYSDFNSYDVSITVPQDYIVSSTGRLQNPKDVLATKYCKRYKKALKSDKIIHIIDSTDMAKGKGFTVNKEWVKWHYQADISPDFAFSVCKDVLWDATRLKLGSKDVLVDAVYKKDADDFYEAAFVAKDALKFLSEDFPAVEYPYTDMTIVNGWAAMEFPMIINDPTVSTHEALQHLTVHEVGHNYFPFYIGTNERKYAWMDEAWANVFPVFYFETREIENGYIPYKLERYYRIAGTEKAQPIITLTDYLTYYPAYRHASYSKPSYALLCLRDFIGKEVFAERLKKYFKDWGFKHPIPYDFFTAFNPDNNADVNWFYNEFYYKTTYADLGIVQENGEYKIVNVGGLPLAFDVQIKFANGKQQKLNYKATIWKNKDKLSLKGIMDVESIEILNQWDLDIDKSNNIYRKVGVED